MMPMPKVQRSQPDETAYELMEAASIDEGAAMTMFDDEVAWPGVVEHKVVAEKTICWWGGLRRA
jgi:hypothetical protein